MNLAFLAALLLAQQPVPALHPDRIIARASELVTWCRMEAEYRYLARGITPYQWTSSYSDRGNVLYVDGRLRADGRTVEVRCQIARGVPASYASMRIDDPRLR